MERGAQNVEYVVGTQLDDVDMVEALCDQTEMDPKLWNKLGEDLLEKIITRLPLKDLVQSQVLSKKWSSRFQSPNFQKEVSALSSRWGLSNFYHPLCVTEKGLSGYDRSSQKWKDFCSLPDFPPDFRVAHSSDTDSSETEGSVGRSRWRLWGRNCFVIGTLVFSGHPTNDGLLHIFVTNVINKTIKKCPPCPFRVYDEWEYNLLEVLDINVHPVGYDHYKLVMISYKERDPDVITAAVYDSKLNSWTEFEYDLPSYWSRCGNVVYVGGVVYVPYGDKFCTFDVEKARFGLIVPSQPISAPGGYFVAWRSELLLISLFDEEDISADKVAIHTVNLQSLEHTEILTGPPEDFDGWISAMTVVSDSDCIHLILLPYSTDIYDPVTREIIDEGFCLDSEGLRIDNRTLDEKNCLVTCEVSKGLWSYSVADIRESGYDRDQRIELCRSCTFQPNLNPFLLA